MLIARITPIGTDRFKTVGQFVKKWNFRVNNPLLMIIPWLMFFSGWVTKAGIDNENMFWDWKGWIPGLILCLLFGGVFFFLESTKRFSFGSEGKGLNELLIPSGVGYLLFLAGFGMNIPAGFISGIPYYAGFLSMLVVYSIPLSEKDAEGEFTINFANGKIDKVRVMISTALMLFALLTGLYRNDPVASTSAAVILPFLIVTAIGNGERHILRTRFYGLFIPAMFISSRIPWLLIPIFIVFYGSRIYNFYTREIVFPSFGVDFNIVRHRKGKKN